MCAHTCVHGCVDACSVWMMPDGHERSNNSKWEIRSVIHSLLRTYFTVFVKKKNVCFHDFIFVVCGAKTFLPCWSDAVTYSLFGACSPTGLYTYTYVPIRIRILHGAHLREVVLRVYVGVRKPFEYSFQLVLDERAVVRSCIPTVRRWQENNTIFSAT